MQPLTFGGDYHLTVGIMALVAQAEREAISRRTKEALAVAKARGVKLGNPNGAAALRRASKRRGAQGGGEGQCPPERGGLGGGGGGNPGGRGDESQRDGAGTDRAGNDDSPRRRVAGVECAESGPAIWLRTTAQRAESSLCTGGIAPAETCEAVFHHADTKSDTKSEWAGHFALAREPLVGGGMWLLIVLTTTSETKLTSAGPISALGQQLAIDAVDTDQVLERRAVRADLANEVILPRQPDQRPRREIRPQIRRPHCLQGRYW